MPRQLKKKLKLKLKTDERVQREKTGEDEKIRDGFLWGDSGSGPRLNGVRKHPDHSETRLGVNATSR